MRLVLDRFGEKLRTLRKQHGMTLHETALALGYADHTHLSAIETGRKKPTAELVLKVSELFHISADRLLRDNVEIDGDDQANIDESSESRAST